MPRHYTKQDVKNLVAQINSEGSAHMKELIAESFLEGDTDNSGTLSCNEVINAFKKCQINFANYQLRELLQKYDKNKDGQLNINEWADMVFAEEAIRQANMKASDIRNIGKEGVVEVSDLGRKFIPHGLVPKYGNYFNRLFQKNNDQDILKLKKIIDPESETDLFEKLGDGIILCQMINYCQKNTIPKKAINWKIPKNNKAIFLERENLDLAINSASAIGLKTINYSSTNFNSRNYNKTLVLGLVWQMVAMHSQRGLNLTSNPFLRKLFPEGTSQAEILRLAPEELLLVWVNYHLDKNPSWDGKKVTNFKSDFTNGKAFIALMNQIQPEENHPKFNHNLMKTGSDSERQTLVENMAKQLHLGDFITAQDIADEEQKITMLFLAELFNLYPGLEDGEEFIDPDDDECKMYKNWINSLGLEGVKKMLYFFPPLVSGNVFLRLVDLMNPGSVNWKKVTSDEEVFGKFAGKLKGLNNCSMVIEACKNTPGMTIVGIGPSNIQESHEMFTKAITWQLMRLYTLNIIKELIPDVNLTDSKAVDAKILEWANQKLESAGKDSRVKSFTDPSLADSKTILDLVDSIQGDAVNYDYLTDDNDENSIYALACCRMIGAKVYALPQHISTPHKKMMMTIFACLMAVDQKNKLNNQQAEETNDVAEYENAEEEA